VVQHPLGYEWSTVSFRVGAQAAPGPGVTVRTCGAHTTTTGDHAVERVPEKCNHTGDVVLNEIKQKVLTTRPRVRKGQEPTRL